MGRRVSNQNENGAALLFGIVVIAGIAILVVLLTAGFYIFPLVLITIAAFTRGATKAPQSFPTHESTTQRLAQLSSHTIWMIATSQFSDAQSYMTLARATDSLGQRTVAARGMILGRSWGRR